MGFVLQFFNLLSMLSAEQKRDPAAEARGRETRPGIGRGGDRERRAAEQAGTPAGPAVRRPAAAGRDRAGVITRPSILFADEPTGNLDSKAGREILALLRTCAASYGQTILTVTHEPRVSSIADRILLLADGQIVQELDHVSSGEVRSAIEALAA